MAATIQQISEFLESEGLRHRIEEGFLRTGFKTENYRDSDGDPTVGLIVKLEENGEFIKIIAPQVYSYADGPHKAALFQTLLMVSWDTKMIQYEYDVNDGEVRAIIEFPLEDAPLTKKQLLRCVHAIAGLIDENHEKVVAAMTRGEVPKPETGDDTAALWAEFQAFLEQKRQGGGAGDHGLPS